MFTRPSPGQPTSDLLSLLHCQEQSNKPALGAASGFDSSILTLILRSQSRVPETRALPSLLPVLRDQSHLSRLLTLHDYQQQQDHLHEVQKARLGLDQTNRPAPLLNSDLFYRLIAQDFTNGLQQQSQRQQEMNTKSPSAAATSKADTRKRDDALLHKLGTVLPRRSDPLIDVSKLQGPAPTDEAFRRNKGGVAETFPEKLHRMLTQTAATSSHIASWANHGRAFFIHDTEAFATELMPQYFCGQGKWSSFARQLRLYGFLRIHAGPDTGAIYHALFLRGRPELCSCMRRVGAPRGRLESRKAVSGGNCHESKGSSSTSVEEATPLAVFKTGAVREGAAPNFYAMDPLP